MLEEGVAPVGLATVTGVGGVCHACSSYRSGWSLSCL